MSGTKKTLTAKTSRTRAALLEAGLELMVERSIDVIPIDDLVEAAGVAKGSFFNHFSDKTNFAAAIALEVRADIEEKIYAANRNIDNPLARLARGMLEAARYALTKRRESIALLRFSSDTSTRDHPMNRGIGEDIAECIDAGFFRKEAKETGVLFWLGLCHAVMVNMIEKDFSRQEAAARLNQMLILGMTGLGADEETATMIAIESSQALMRIDDETD